MSDCTSDGRLSFSQISLSDVTRLWKACWRSEAGTRSSWARLLVYNYISIFEVRNGSPNTMIHLKLTHHCYRRDSIAKEKGRKAGRQEGCGIEKA